MIASAGQRRIWPLFGIVHVVIEDPNVTSTSFTYLELDSVSKHTKKIPAKQREYLPAVGVTLTPEVWLSKPKGPLNKNVACMPIGTML